MEGASTSSPLNSTLFSGPLSADSQRLLRSPRKPQRKVPKNPYKVCNFSFKLCQVLDAPELQDDFYLNLVDWSAQNMLSVGLNTCVYLWSAMNSQVSSKQPSPPSRLSSCATCRPRTTRSPPCSGRTREMPSLWAPTRACSRSALSESQPPLSDLGCAHTEEGARADRPHVAHRLSRLEWRPHLLRLPGSLHPAARHPAAGCGAAALLPSPRSNPPLNSNSSSRCAD